MKIYRLITNDEKNIYLNPYLINPLDMKMTHICTLSSFYFDKSRDDYGKYFFLFKEDAIKWLEERARYRLKEAFSIIEMDVPKIKILKHIGFGLYSKYSCIGALKGELRMEVLIPRSEIINRKFNEIKAINSDEFDDFISSGNEQLSNKHRKIFAKDLTLDFNLKPYSGSLSSSTFRFDIGGVIKNEDSLSKKLDDYESDLKII